MRSGLNDGGSRSTAASSPSTTTQARLLRLAGEPLQPFTVYNAGLYDYSTVRNLAWGDYRKFALELFQCRDEAHDIAGVQFDGYLGDSSVLVYNFKDRPDTQIGELFVEDVASMCRGRLSDRCFIIAPALSVEPYEDYLERGGTRFYFLRIPYSIIAALHKRAFSELRQPTSRDTFNAIIDAVGFDFIQPPEVEARWAFDDGTVTVEIVSFQSQAYAASDADHRVSDFSMLMVDTDFDGTVFDFNHVFYGDGLQADNWVVQLEGIDAGAQILVIYLDVFGNEHREMKRVTELDSPKAAGVGRNPSAPRKKAAARKRAKSKSAAAKKTAAKKTAAKKTAAKKTTAKKAGR